MACNSLVLGLITSCAAAPAVGQDAQLDLERRCGTLDCVAEISQAYCHFETSTVEECRGFIRAIEKSSRRDSRELQLTCARAHLGLASLAMGGPVPDGEEHARATQRAKEIFGALIRRDARDPDALFELATITEDREERLALFRRAVAAAPDATLPRRFLATELAQGSPGEQADGLESMRQAYQVASIPHRWHIGQEVVNYLVRLDRHTEALEFQRKVLSNLGTAQAELAIRRARRFDGAKPSEDLVAAVELLCDRRSIRLGTTQSCVDGIETLTGAVLAGGANDSRGIPDLIADAALWILRDTGAKDQDYRVWERLQAALDRFSGSSLETPLLLDARAQIMVMVGSSRDAKRPSALLERAVNLAPYDGEARMRLGQQYIEEGRPEDAIAQLEAAIPLLPDYLVSSAQFDLVAALRKAGLAERAAQLEQQIGK